MKIIIAPDSFKGSLSSIEAADAIERGIILGVGNRSVDIVKLPLGDGGEGTVDAMIGALGGKKVSTEVLDPLMRPIKAEFAIVDDNIAIIEMASASGLTLLNASERNPLITSTYGTGQLINAAIEFGCKKIIIGIGGSATNDGGSGAMSALGAKFLDRDGNELPPGGASLKNLYSIDMAGFRFPVGRVQVEAACDVTNPLIGPLGASAVYGPQKGASNEDVFELDAALANYGEVIKRELGCDVINRDGAGAAGGLGAALSAFLKAELRSGIDIVLDAVGFNEALTGADIVITGEGKIDEQSGFGKVLDGILKRASKNNVPVVAIAGAISGDIRTLYDKGLTSAFSIALGPMSLDYAMANSAMLLRSVSANIARLLVNYLP